MRTVVFTIAAGTALSGKQWVPGKIAGIHMSDDWTAAGMSMQASADDDNYWEVIDTAGSAVALTVAADRFIPTSLLALPYGCYVKLRSGTSATPVNQAVQAVIKLVCEEGA